MNPNSETADLGPPSSPEVSLPQQFPEDLTLEAAVGVKALQYLATVAEDDAKKDTGDAFTFPSMMLSTPSSSRIKDSLFFCQGPSSRSTVASVSLKSWSHDELEQATMPGMQEAKAEITGDSIVFRPQRVPFSQRKSRSDPTVVRPATDRGELRPCKSASPAPLHGKFFNTKLKKRLQGIRRAETQVPVAKSLGTGLEMPRRRNNSNPGETDVFSWRDEDNAPVKSLTDHASAIRNTPDIIFHAAPMKPTPMQTQPGIVRRFVPFLRMSKRPPPVSFPLPERGLGFELESALFAIVKLFNGYWKAVHGAKDLSKAQESLPQWKKLHHRLDGPIRFLLLDCTKSHFRLASWTAVIQHQEQRPWSGQIITFIGSKKDNVDFHMTVELKGMSIEAKTTWNEPSRGSLLETYSLSSDRQSLTLTVKIDMRSQSPANKGATRTSMVHSVLFDKV